MYTLSMHNFPSRSTPVTRSIGQNQQECQKMGQSASTMDLLVKWIGGSLCNLPPILPMLAGKVGRDPEG